MRPLYNGIKFIIHYFDDFCVFSNTFSAHLDHIKETVTILKNAGLIIKPSKVYLDFSTDSFLGHKIGQDIVRSEPDNIKKIFDFPVPEYNKNIRSLLGLINYYFQISPRMAQLNSTFAALIKKNHPTKDPLFSLFRTMFTRFKNYVQLTIYLAFTYMRLPFLLTCNASDNVVGFCLIQEFVNIRHPVMKFS